jgi:hypothetical protein
MTDAALEDDAPAPLEQTPGEAVETPETESAPVEQAETPAEPEDKELSPRGQERFNKITADKYAEKRRADAAEARLRELEAKVPQQQPESVTAPKLEDFDYDESKYNEALIDYKVNQKAAQIQQQQEAAQSAAKQQQAAEAFNAKVASFAEQAPDYQEAVGNIPPLPAETLDVVMQAENGPQLAYYLGKHLDIADEIASASPYVAAMKLGAISERLAAVKPNVTTSAAPDPIEPISSGGSISRDLSEMSMEEIYNL